MILISFTFITVLFAARLFSPFSRYMPLRFNDFRYGLSYFRTLSLNPFHVLFLVVVLLFELSILFLVFLFLFIAHFPPFFCYSTDYVFVAHIWVLFLNLVSSFIAEYKVAGHRAF